MRCVHPLAPLGRAPPQILALVHCPWAATCTDPSLYPHSIGSGGSLCVALHVSCSKYTGSAHPGFNRYKGAPQYSGKTTSPLHFWQLDSLVKTTEHEFEYYRQRGKWQNGTSFLSPTRVSFAYISKRLSYNASSIASGAINK